MPIVAITVDTEFPDQPAEDPLGTCDRLLEVLSRHGAKATFFITGSWARAYPERVRAIARGGHQIGNHSYSHCSLSRMTRAGITEDLDACHDLIAELGIETRPWFRAPYGGLDHDTVDVQEAIEQAGYRHVHWDVSPEDWRPGRGPEQIADATAAQVQQCWPRPAIVLLHSWPDATPAALDLALTRLQADGADFRRLDQIGGWQMTIGRLRAALERAR